MHFDPSSFAAGAVVCGTLEIVTHLALVELHSRRGRRRRDAIAQSMGFGDEAAWRAMIPAIGRFGSRLAIALAVDAVAGVRRSDVLDQTGRRGVVVVTVSLRRWARWWPPARARTLFAVTAAITQSLPAGAGYELRIAR